MNKNIFITILIIAILVLLGLYLTSDKTIVDQNPLVVNSTTTVSVTDEKMDLVVYLQDKDIAATSDCRVTKKTTIQVPKTVAVANASLEFLFSDELKAYGVYDSVEIVNGTAKVMLKSDMTPAGSPISSLSSCQSGHLLSVLKDTLTQYDTIKSVKLYSPKAEIIF